MRDSAQPKRNPAPSSEEVEEEESDLEVEGGSGEGRQDTCDELELRRSVLRVDVAVALQVKGLCVMVLYALSSCAMFMGATAVFGSA